MEQPPRRPIRRSLRPLVSRPVLIGSKVWIGDGVVVTAGAEIGEGSVIGANSVVIGRVAPFTVLSAPRPDRLRRFASNGSNG